MALLDVTEEISSKGFEKTLDANSTALILENLQKFQYKYPIDSTVREVVSNAIDSVREKNIAIEILTGKSQIEDYYQVEEGSIYESSKFNSDYYDLNHLSSEDSVEVIYRIKEDRDEFIVIDKGVGLGGSRLEGFFQLAYSSKRLSKSTLGRYGLGAKAPLSTGCDSFTIESIYNGKLFKFEIFTHKVDSLIGKFGENGKNDLVEFSNGYKCYYETTQKENGVKIIIPVKKHNKHKFLTAVTKQLMYLPERILFKIQEGDEERLIDFKARRLFETNDIIISKNDFFTKPHIVLNNTVYGFIDFDELDLETRYGSVGFKLDIENIDISPSREEVLWTAKTKAEILKKYEAVTATASEYISEELKGLNYFEWVSKACKITRSNNEGPLYHLSRICNISTVSLKWDKDATKTYSLDLNSMWSKSWEVDIFSNNFKGVPNRSSTNSTSAFCSNYSFDKLYLKDCNYQGKMVAYLSHLQSSAIVFKRDGIIKGLVYGTLSVDEVEEMIQEMPLGTAKTALKNDLDLYRFFVAQGVKLLSQLVIPDTFITSVSVEENEDGSTVVKKDTAEAYKALRAQRKALGRSPVFLIYDDNVKRTEIALNTLADDNIFIYGYKEDKNDLINYSKVHDCKTYMVSKVLGKKFQNQVYVKDIKPSIDTKGNLTPHFLTVDYLKHILYNDVYNKSFRCVYTDYKGRASINYFISRIEELAPISQYRISKSGFKDNINALFQKYTLMCIYSEMSQEDIFKLNEEELKNLYPGDYTGIKFFTEEELDLFRRFAAFLDVFSPFLNLGFDKFDLKRADFAALELTEQFFASRKDEYGYPLTLNLD